MNTFGKLLRISMFGESHGAKIGITIDNITPGLPIDQSFIKECLSKRRPTGPNETPRVEIDDFEIVSGEFNGFTTGAPLTILIPNNDTKPSDYDKTLGLMRPGHADYTSHIKYSGYEDYRGGGHFSGRLTAAIVAGGAIVLQALEKIGIKIGSHILKIRDVEDDKFTDIENQIDELNELYFPVINQSVLKEMSSIITEARLSNDSVGGIIECGITGLPVGLGEPMFDSIESVLSHAMFSIGSVKGIEFGDGFNFANLLGSEANDELFYENNRVQTKTNHNGGINGGISNSMPILFNVVVKPTASISKAQDTININTRKNDVIEISGRHDPAIVRRINIVLRSMSAFVIADFLIQRYGINVLREGFNKNN